MLTALNTHAAIYPCHPPLNIHKEMGTTLMLLPFLRVSLQKSGKADGPHRFENEIFHLQNKYTFRGSANTRMTPLTELVAMKWLSSVKQIPVICSVWAFKAWRVLLFLTSWIMSIPFSWPIARKWPCQSNAAIRPLTGMVWNNSLVLILYTTHELSPPAEPSAQHIPRKI